MYEWQCSDNQQVFPDEIYLRMRCLIALYVFELHTELLMKKKQDKQQKIKLCMREKA